MSPTTTTKLAREDLYSLEQYSIMRDEFRLRVMKHKENRRIELGNHLLLLFEDKLIMQYQVQEMLKAEKIFDVAGINEELDAYNPLIPDGTNWKATMMIQYTDIEQRQHMLSQLIGIELLVWLQVEGFEKVFAIANEDLIERDNEEKTSAVHFLRFELTPEMVIAAKNNANLSAGVDHKNYNEYIKPLSDNIADALRQDLV